MTPKEALKKECRYCKAGNRFDCESGACKLNDKSLTSLKRIKAYCLDCVGSRAEVIACTGGVLNPEPRECPLWKYRLGKNSRLKGRKGNVDHLRLFMKKAKTSDSDFSPA